MSEDKELMLRLLRKEERRLEEPWSHLSYTPKPLKEVRDEIRKRGGYK